MDDFAEIVGHIENVENLRALLDPPGRNPTDEQRQIIEARIAEVTRTRYA